MAQNSPRYGVNRLRGLPFVGPYDPRSLRLGDTYYVCSTYGVDEGGQGGDPTTPFATIDYAIGQCTSANNDTIIALAGHTETAIAAATIKFDVAGVTLIGLGTGTSRPTINYTTAVGASVNVTAANVTLENIYFDMTGVDTVTAGINVQAASFTMRNCEVLHADGTGQATLAVLTTAAANNMLIENCRFIGSGDAGTATAIRVVGGDGITIRNNYIAGAYTNTIGGIQNASTLSSNLDIDNNFVSNTTADSTVCIDLMTGATGVVRNNKLVSLTDAGFGQVDTPGSVSMFLNLGVNQAGEASRVIPIGTLSA